MAKNESNGRKKNGGTTDNGDRDIFCRIRDAFGVFARKTSTVLGSAWAFVIAILIIVCLRIGFWATVRGLAVI